MNIVKFDILPCFPDGKFHEAKLDDVLMRCCDKYSLNYDEALCLIDASMTLGWCRLSVALSLSVGSMFNGQISRAETWYLIQRLDEAESILDSGQQLPLNLIDPNIDRSLC